ncbi:uncharacterized protein UTRI_05426_B [Ustilago trichophora]|uniref:Uncharacterized protein n=1 Tax=Ustilago trichophora TaxID=86804 RepID=A0A5C3ELG7_9BASI|nr:uncharacterized protein UTRI_05426_B [Ustilago trichophora]
MAIIFEPSTSPSINANVNVNADADTRCLLIGPNTVRFCQRCMLLPHTSSKSAPYGVHKILPDADVANLFPILVQAAEPPPLGSSTPELALLLTVYVLDVHGQLFLHDTVPKNLTSCFKNVDFLDFFFKRIRPNPASRTAAPSYAGSGSISRHDILTQPKDSRLPEDWSDVPPYNGMIGPQETRSREELYSSACKLGDSEGYEWISPCGPELNLVRCQDTPLVYRELSEEGMLKWAGSLIEPFRPDQLMVDPSNGYVYHPSPRPSSRRRQGGEKEKESKYGKLSLLGSNLVLSRLADGLEIDPDAFERGQGGSIEWQGKRYELGLLKPD